MKRTTAFTLAASLIIALTASVALADTAAAATGSPAPAHLGAPRQHRLLIIGASYTAGWGAGDPRDDYANLLARDLDWPATISAEPGAGYLSRGNNGHDSFLEQIAALPPTLRPGLVIIQGGRNDAGHPAARERVAIEQTIAAIRAKFGDPQIVLVGDIPASLPVSPAAVATNDTLGRAAAHDHVVFIDPIDEHWTTAGNAIAFRSHVPGHPNDAGHAYIAQRLVADLDQRSDGAIGGNR